MAEKFDLDKVKGLALNLNRWRRGDLYAPHKPLLLLHALANVQKGGPRLTGYPEVAEALAPMISMYGHSSGRPDTLDPFWRLQGDKLWEIPGAIERTDDARPPLTSKIRGMKGGFPKAIFDFLAGHPEAINGLAWAILDRYFEETLHQDIIQDTGLVLSSHLVSDTTAKESARGKSRPARDPAFQSLVLNAYEHRCAFCGFQCHLDRRSMLLEAAHLRGLKYDGPDRIDNGLALCNLHHKALDFGLISLRESGTIIVSSRASGDALVSLSGKSFFRPRSPSDQIAAEHIRWHREKGPFKRPARAV